MTATEPAPPRPTALRCFAVAMVLAFLSGGAVACSTSPGSLPRACAIFDRGYARWQTAVADVPDRGRLRPRLAAADATLLGALDQATAEAGGTNLATALQAVAAGVRRLDGALDNHDRKAAGQAHRLMSLAVVAVRRTCPRV